MQKRFQSRVVRLSQFASVALTALSLAAVASSSGCKSAPAEKKVIAEVAAPLVIPPAPAGATRYSFSNADSKVEFVGAKITGTHSGAFGAFTGSVYVDATSVEKNMVTVEIDMASLTADDPKLAGHLKAPDFFDVATYPKARFASTELTVGAGPNGGTHQLSGNLQMHGVTKLIKFPINVQSTPDTVSVDADFGINRKEFGIVYPGMPDDLIKDEVRIKLTIRAKKAS